MSNNNMTIDDLGAIIKNEFDNVKNELKVLKQGQENIELTLLPSATRATNAGHTNYFM